MIKREDMNKKNYLYAHCENCDEEGIYFVDDMEQNCFIKCNNCNAEMSDVWCEDCGMGGPFIENLNARPDKWQCPDCSKEYNLSYDFYNNPITLYRENQVPKEVLKNIDNSKKKVKKGLFGFMKRE